VVEQALVAAGVMSVLLVIAAGVVAAVAVRGRRRRFRAARKRIRSITVTQPRLRSTLRAPTSSAAGRFGSPGWWAAQNRRHRMRKAVSSAEHAVAVARRADVAVGDLPGLTAQLRAAARGVDSVLRAGARSGSLRDEDRADCDRIEAAAFDIHAAAMASLRSASQAETDPVVSAVQIEVTALAAGVRAARP
jgi:hypothetical protein